MGSKLLQAIVVDPADPAFCFTASFLPLIPVSLWLSLCSSCGHWPHARWRPVSALASVPPTCCAPCRVDRPGQWSAGIQLRAFLRCSHTCHSGGLRGLHLLHHAGIGTLPSSRRIKSPARFGLSASFHRPCFRRRPDEPELVFAKQTPPATTFTVVSHLALIKLHDCSALSC